MLAIVGVLADLLEGRCSGVTAVTPVLACKIQGFWYLLLKNDQHSITFATSARCATHFP